MDSFQSWLPSWNVQYLWSCSQNICDGLFDLETVYAVQMAFMEHGEEICHHLVVCIVGAARSGKTSLIRKLVGEEVDFI